MTDRQPLYLVMVEANANNNKFYRMIPNGSTFEVQYGRVGSGSFQTMTYPMSKWHEMLRSKLRKGYVDQTRLVAQTVTKRDQLEYADLSNPSIKSIVSKLMAMANQAIRENYTISSKMVTTRMIDEAQYLLGSLSNCKDLQKFNDTMLELFRTIPRKMRRVHDYMASSPADFRNILEREQNLLDVMRGQVVQEEIVGDVQEDTSTELKQTILEALGLQLAETDAKDIATIKTNLQEMHYRFSQAWQVVNTKTQKAFDSFIKETGITNTKLLWHGSRNENWWSILNSGLVLRPNAITTGKMFGYGIYFAPSADKSFGYTSYHGSRWAGGNENVAYMSLFDVAYGTPYDVYSFESSYHNLNYQELQKRKAGANCLHAHAGNMLRKDEIVVYKENQITVKYLVELK